MGKEMARRGDGPGPDLEALLHLRTAISKALWNLQCVVEIASGNNGRSQWGKRFFLGTALAYSLVGSGKTESN
jgi:hypothetical protein